MTRSEATRAVVEAARIIVRRYCAGLAADATGKPDKQTLIESVRALDACKEPDLDAFNASVAEAVEEYFRRSPMMLNTDQYSDGLWVSVTETIKARRAALKPRPRYTVCDGDRILDGKYGYCLAPQCIAGLLNAQEKP